MTPNAMRRPRQPARTRSPTSAPILSGSPAPAREPLAAAVQLPGSNARDTRTAQIAISDVPTRLRQHGKVNVLIGLTWQTARQQRDVDQPVQHRQRQCGDLRSPVSASDSIPDDANTDMKRQRNTARTTPMP